MRLDCEWKLSVVNASVLRTLLDRADSNSELIRDFWRIMMLCFNTPRPSTNYDGVDDLNRSLPIRKAIKQVCKDRNLNYAEDSVFNMIISHSSNKAKVCFQGHMDVVVSKNESVEHNFESEGVDVRITEDGTIKPIKGITLGADNGVAIAAGLAVLANHPSIPMELLITQNEETCFSGALGVDVSLISADTMLNLDSEVEGAICLGSAGGFEQHFFFPIDEQQLDESCQIVNIKIKDLKGGHSGIDIDKEKVNAIFAINRLLVEISRIDPNMRLIDINGGTSINSIPRECSATIALSPSTRVEEIEFFFEIFRKEICSNEPDVKIIISRPFSNTQSMSVECTSKIVSLLAACPNGVMRRIIATGDIESSLNLGLVRTDTGEVILKFLVRSTSVSWMKYFAKQLTGIGHLAGAQVAEYQGAFGAWEPDFGSSVLKTLIESFPGTGEPKLYTVHAGLESSPIMEKFSDTGRSLECASIGPQIEHAHSPDECLFIKSAVQFVSWLDAFVRKL